MYRRRRNKFRGMLLSDSIDKTNVLCYLNNEMRHFIKCVKKEVHCYGTSQEL